MGANVQREMRAGMEKKPEPKQDNGGNQQQSNGGTQPTQPAQPAQPNGGK